MKALKISSLLAVGAIAAVGAAMAITNPGREDYEDYAVRQLNQQLNDRVCTKAPIFLNDMCGSFLDNNDALLRTVVADGTQRQNFGVLSIYKTEISTETVLQEILPPSLSLSLESAPVYEFESVGVLQRFFTYKVKGL
ncbi:MAG: DUF4359 domain-containing protein [Elainellaceae cyanobacterium]